MSGHQLRIVRAEDGADPTTETIAEAAQRALLGALAEGPVALVILWETPCAVNWCAVPPSEAVERGLIGLVTQHLHTEE